MTDEKTVLVIGGGIAGPVAAIALRRAGIEVTVYEAYDRTADRALGGAMTIGLNGLYALSVLNLDHVVREISVPTPRVIQQSGTGKLLAEFSEPSGLPIGQTVARTDLYRAMCDELVDRGGRIEYGKRLVGADDVGDGVIAHFADGSQAHGDILIGADGIYSTVRSLIDSNAPQPSYVGLIGFVGWVTNPGLTPADGVCHQVYGKRAYFGYIIYEDDCRTLWWSYISAERPMSIQEMRAVPADEWLRQLREKVADDNSPALDILRHVKQDELMVTGALEYLPHVPAWHRGRMVLVGDSAHATPFAGQGAAMAIEDAIQLARCVRDLPTVADAFAGYEDLRRARAHRVTARAERTVSRIMAHWDDNQTALKKEGIDDLFTKPENRDWLFGYRIDWDAPVATELTISTTM